jgi:hypothetical protein
MNELASVFLSVLNQESVAYWCFSNFMLNDNYSASSMTLNTKTIDQSHVLKTTVSYYFSDEGISKKLKHLSHLLSIIDPALYKHLEKYNMQNLNFCHEWLLLCFKRCFGTTKEYQHCFEILSSQFFELYTSSSKNINIKNLYSFDLFVCLSLLKQMRDTIINKTNSDTDIFEVFHFYNKKNLLAANFLETFQIAEDIFDKYSSLASHMKDDENNNNNNKSGEKVNLSKKLKEFFK